MQQIENFIFSTETPAAEEVAVTVIDWDNVDDEHIQATDDELKQAHDVEHSWGHIIKLSFIVLKVCLISYFLISGLIAHRRKDRQFTLISVILGLYIVILCGLLAFDLGTKFIFAFFFMCYTANYLNFLGMNILLRNIPSSEAQQLRKNTNTYWWVMNSLYVLVMVLALSWLSRLGPKCRPNKLYPPCMNYASILFIINSIYHYYIHKQNYWLKWEGANETLLPLAEGQKVRFQKVTKDLTLMKPIFQEQMRIYVCYQVVVSVVQLLIQYLGRIFIHNHNFLGCTDKGWQWIYLTLPGDLFVTLHMMSIIMQAVMVERVFYGVPHTKGYFEDDHTVEPEKDQEHAEATKADDDGFKAIN